MVNVTLSIQDSLRKRMKKHPEMRWSNVFSGIVEQQLDAFERAEAAAKRLDLSWDDVKGIVEKIEADTRKHYGAVLNEAGRRR